MILHASTSNAGKMREFLAACEQTGVHDISIQPLLGLAGIASPAEEGDTFEENARRKAIYYSQYTTEIVFADDSGLEVDALHGDPGVHSARYAGEKATDAENNGRLLANMQGQTARQGRFVCVIALARQGKILLVVRGVVEGEILNALHGHSGFGYDPLFFYPPKNCSFGELSSEEQFTVSHRGQAVRKMLQLLAAGSV